MNREQFMERLTQLLSDISQEERQEAIAYYTSYFEDAGIENEASIIEELESPEKVAATIKAGLNGEDGLQERTLKNALAVSLEKKSEYEQQENSQDRVSGEKTYDFYGNTPANNGNRIVLIIVVALLTSPIWVSVAGGICSVLFGIIVTVGALAFAGFTVGVGCVSVAIEEVTIGVVADGIALLGIGLLGFAVGLLFLVLLLLICGKFLPWAVRSIVNWIQKVLHIGKGGEFA